MTVHKYNLPCTLHVVSVAYDPSRKVFFTYCTCTAAVKTVKWNSIVCSFCLSYISHPPPPIASPVLFSLAIIIVVGIQRQNDLPRRFQSISIFLSVPHVPWSNLLSLFVRGWAVAEYFTKNLTARCALLGFIQSCLSCEKKLVVIHCCCLLCLPCVQPALFDVTM